MAKTRKIQVTLDEVQYERLAEIARRQDKKLARVVRESIVRYCIEPETQRKKRDAIEELLGLEPTPVPDDYATWETEYGGRKGTGGLSSEDEAPRDGNR